MFKFLSKIRNTFSGQSIREKYERYESHLSTGALLLGFIFDNLTLRRIDRLFENLVLFSYLFLAALGIVLINVVESQNGTEKTHTRWHTALLILIQFSFGNLFSAFIIFYVRSASLGASWPFLLLLLGLLVGNELLKKRYLRLPFQVTVYFVTLFSFWIFYVPIILGTIGTWVFLVSGAVSLILISLFLYILRRAVPLKFKESKRYFIWGVGGFYIALNLLYFANIIPPIPLSLKDVGVYHAVEKTSNGDYRVVKEVRPWYEFFFPFTRVTFEVGKPLYVLSSVFAPTRLDTDIVHDWQYFDEDMRRWMSESKIHFPIVGGADGGYRGYSQKTNTFPGYWRVDIETSGGQTLGRLKFRIIDSAKPLLLQTKVL